eukprot:COSAG02_NODE_28256_length_593_cov_0.720648_1_plen_95_part_10
MERAHQGGSKRGAGTPKVARSTYAESPWQRRSAASQAQAPPVPEPSGADIAAPQAAAHSARLFAAQLLPTSALPNPAALHIGAAPPPTHTHPLCG